MHWRTVLWIDCFSVQGKGGFIRGLFLFLFCFFFWLFFVTYWYTYWYTCINTHLSVLLTSLISWDRCVHVYHDTPPLDGENSYNTKRSMIRTIEEAHTSDITCMSYSRDLSLIATGDTNGWVKIW